MTSGQVLMKIWAVDLEAEHVNDVERRADDNRGGHVRGRIRRGLWREDGFSGRT